MSNIEYLIKNESDLGQFAKGYFSYISSLLEQLEISKIEEFVKELEAARQNQNTVFFVGNGGSAATASHMANDLGFGSRMHVDFPFRVLSLTDNVPTMTAIANDSGYDNLFIHQIQLYYRLGDKLVAISASGNSPNIVAVAEWVKKKGGKVISLIGFDGGRLKELSDIPIVVNTPKGEYGPVEDIHMILNHLIYTWIWHKRRKEENR